MRVIEVVGVVRQQESGPIEGLLVRHPGETGCYSQPICRATIAEELERGRVVRTALGEQVRVIQVSGRKFLRTDPAPVAGDHFGALPTVIGRRRSRW